MAAIASTAAAADARQRLFVYGDSLAVGTEPFLPDALPDWRVKQDVDYTRHTRSAVSALRARGDRLPRVVHLSLGTVDDPTRTRRFRRSVRRVMRIVGPGRCVVWPNIYRPDVRPDGWVINAWRTLNRVLEDEAGERDNLVVFDWASIVTAHIDWLSPADGTHVNEEGYRYRAREVATSAEECLARLEGFAGAG